MKRLYFTDAVVVVNRLVKRGDIDALNFRELFQDFGAGVSINFTLLQTMGNFNYCFFSITKQDRIKKVSYGLRVKTTGTATEDNRHTISPIFGTQRNSGKIENGEDIGVTEFVGQGESHEIKIQQ